MPRVKQDVCSSTRHPRYPWRILLFLFSNDCIDSQWIFDISEVVSEIVHQPTLAGSRDEPSHLPPEPSDSSKASSSLPTLLHCIDYNTEARFESGSVACQDWEMSSHSISLFLQRDVCGYAFPEPVQVLIDLDGGITKFHVSRKRERGANTGKTYEDHMRRQTKATTTQKSGDELTTLRRRAISFFSRFPALSTTRPRPAITLAGGLVFFIILCYVFICTLRQTQRTCNMVLTISRPTGGCWDRSVLIGF